MIENKHISAVVAVAMSLALVFCSLLLVFGTGTEGAGAKTVEPEYVSQLFSGEVMDVDIVVEESDWQNLLDNATAEEYMMADVVINNHKVNNIGLRAKGNSSLTQVAQSDSDRYSFRLQFDNYVKGQNCFGLDSMVLNNMLGDYSYMKEYVSYALMKAAGVDAPCFGYANISVNGESWGLYLAVELYNDSYEQRVFGDTSGMLYNVKSMDIGGGPGGNRVENMPGKASDDFSAQAPGDMGQKAAENANSSESRRGGFGGGRGDSGGSLLYTDDSVSSYGAIFDNVVGKGAESDYERVIAALKALGEGRDLETYFDVDRILRYLAAHTVVVNLDSYSSNMAQNYYLYEKDGKITVLPWDYNLAWGGFQGGSASSVVNFPIDTPVSGVEMSERPLLEKLFANAEYLERYHGYLQQILDDYFADGKFGQTLRALDAQIAPYVEADATAFCSYEQYQKALEALIKLGTLRGESIQGQLDGSVPATTAAQSAQPDKLIAAQDVDMNALGTMGMGGGRGDAGAPGRPAGESTTEEGTTGEAASGEGATAPEPPNGGQPGGQPGENQGGFGTMPDPTLMRQAMEILAAAGGTVTDEVREQLLALGLTEAQIEMLAKMPSGMPGGMPGGQQGSPGNGFDPGAQGG